jgi:Tol biopolymer transport system component
VPYAWRHSYVDGDAPRLMTDSRRDGGTRQLFSINITNYGEVRQHTSGLGSSTIAFNGAVSPDGLLIAAAVANGEYPSLALITFNRQQLYISPIAPPEQSCNYQSPSWLPDGSGLIFAANCKGKFAIYRGDITYYDYPNDDYIGAQITNIRDLSNSPTVDNYFPRLSPDGSHIVFSSNRDGDGDLYVINIDGTGERRLTTGTRDDGSASWSPDGTEIVFDSNRDGDYELYKMNVQSRVWSKKL